VAPLYPSSFLFSCPNRGDERRRIERMMSRCFIWFPIGGLGEPNIYHDSECFTRIGDPTWRLSDCEELVGVTHRREWSSYAKKRFQKQEKHFWP